jgi:DNA-binding NtrC family response regulator
LLVVDRNPHIRAYLRREFVMEGYRVRQAESFREALRLIDEQKKVDLMIIDPDLPDAEETLLFGTLQSLLVRMHIVIHTLMADYPTHAEVPSRAVFIEKDGNSIERLKQAVAHQLGHQQPSTA